MSRGFGATKSNSRNAEPSSELQVLGRSIRVRGRVTGDGSIRLEGEVDLRAVGHDALAIANLDGTCGVHALQRFAGNHGARHRGFVHAVYVDYHATSPATPDVTVRTKGSAGGPPSYNILVLTDLNTDAVWSLEVKFNAVGVLELLEDLSQMGQ